MVRYIMLRDPKVARVVASAKTACRYRADSPVIGADKGKNMKRVHLLFVLVLFGFFLIMPTGVRAQAWSGVLDPGRAIDWSTSGVVGGIPTRTTNCASLGAAGQLPSFVQSVTAAQINSAISACAGGQTVFLNTGTYNLNAGVTFGGTSNVTLRGAGADKTLLVFGNNGSCGLLADVCIWSGDFSDRDTVKNSANWTAGYSAGTTVITLSSTTNLFVGNIIHLDQLDDPTDGYPATGYIYVCSTANVCTGQGGGASSRSGRGQMQLSVVTAINGNNVTISPGLAMPNWRSSQTPQAWWPNSIIHDDGIENLTVNNTTATICGTCGGIVIFNARNCWIKGVRNIEPNPTDGTPLATHIWLDNDIFITVRDSYLYGSNNSSQSYGVELFPAQWTLIENNIFQHVTSNVVNNGASVGNVIAYNFSIDDNYTAGGSAPTWMDPSFTWHEVGEAMDLYEGNSGLGLDTDNIHGTHHFGTFFRNHFYGDIWNIPAKSANTQVVQLQAFSRFFNFVGNVLGRPGYYNNYAGGNATSIYDVGGQRYNGAPYGDDARTSATLMRWANWDTVTNATRFCGNSSDTGWSTTCASTSEIPTGLAFYANAVPTKGDTGAGQAALPPSFYLRGTPPWWNFPLGTTAPFPAVGPDVTGGNIIGYGGHAYMIPARNCWVNMMGGVLGTSGLLSFNADTCYLNNSATSPAAPTNLQATVQ
jgi:hypothetical protein